MNNYQYINGKLEKKDGQYSMKTQFMRHSAVIDVELEEILEDFEGKSIELSISEKHTEDPIYTMEKWESAPETTCDPDYEHASEEAYEKFLDMKFGMMIHFGLYTHLGLLESWSVRNQECPNAIMDV